MVHPLMLILFDLSYLSMSPTTTVDNIVLVLIWQNLFYVILVVLLLMVPCIDLAKVSMLHQHLIKRIHLTNVTVYVTVLDVIYEIILIQYTHPLTVYVIVTCLSLKIRMLWQCTHNCQYMVML